MNNTASHFAALAGTLNALLWLEMPRTCCTDARMVHHPIVQALYKRHEELVSYERQDDDHLLRRWKVEYARPAPHRVHLIGRVPDSGDPVSEYQGILPSREDAMQVVRQFARDCLLMRLELTWSVTPVER